MDVRHTPVVHRSRSKRLFRVISDVRTEAVDRSAVVVVRTSYDIPLFCIGFDTFSDHLETSMEEATAEVAKVLILRILPSACEM